MHRRKLGKVLVASPECDCNTSSAAKRLVTDRRVLVDGLVAGNVWQRLSPASEVTILTPEHDRVLTVLPSQTPGVPVMVVYHKPCGVVTSFSDDRGAPRCDPVP